MGAIAAMDSMAIYAIALGFFLALTLLVASMEEGGGNLSQATPELTAAIVLLTQGVGFEAGSLKLTIIPLLLTVLLIALLASFVRRRVPCSWHGYIPGAIVWLVVDVGMAHGVPLVLSDSLWLVACKGALVFTIGFALGAVPGSTILERARVWWHANVSARLRDTLRLGALLGLGLIAWYLLIGTITTLAWIIANHAAMGRVFHMSGMGTGSRILTTVCSLAWLPNLCIWAMSWVSGGGFSIGDLAAFSLWNGGSSSLPPLPVFGLLPQAIPDDRLRLTLIAMPIVVSAIAGGLTLLLHRGFSIRTIDPDVPERSPLNVVVSMVYAAGSFCLACVVLIVATVSLFGLSSGALGRDRLGHVGADAMASTRVLGHPTALGLMTAWLVTAVTIAAVHGFRLLAQRYGTHIDDTAPAASLPEESAAAETGDAASTPRVIMSIPHTKEVHDDDNTSTDTKGSGLRLP